MSQMTRRDRVADRSIRIGSGLFFGLLLVVPAAAGVWLLLLKPLIVGHY